MPFNTNCNFAAYNMLRQFAYRLPGCDRLYLENYNLPYKHIEDCETEQKVTRLLKLAGQKDETKYYSSQAANTANVRFGTSSSTGQDVTLTMLLPLPWCSPATLGTSRAAKPYPAHLTTQPIELYFMLNDLAQVIQNYSPTSATTKWNLADVSISFLYGTFADPAQYKATKYFYATLMPFDHIYPIQWDGATQNTQGVLPTVDVPLRGLRNGEIREVLLHVGDQANAIPDPYSSYEIGQISLFYAGQKIWSTQQRQHDLMELLFDSRVSHEISNKKLIKLNNLRGTDLVANTDTHDIILMSSLSSADPIPAASITFEADVYE